MRKRGTSCRLVSVCLSVCLSVCHTRVLYPDNQSINQFNSNLAAREPDSKGYAVGIIDKNSKRNKQCAYMYIGAGRDV